MKDPGNAAEKLLDLPYAPEAEAYLDELERTGQFRVGIEAEQDDADTEDQAGTDYAFRRGSGNVAIADWWTHKRICIRIGVGILPETLTIARVKDSLVVRTADGTDRLTLEGYLGLIPDASTLRVEFAEGTVWNSKEVLSRVANWQASVTPVQDPLDPAL